MISMERSLLGENVGTGDSVQRHRDYGQSVAQLDIIVLTKKGYQTKQLADNVFCYPTNSFSKLFYFSKAKKIARRIFARDNYDLVVCQDPFLTGLVGYFIKRKFKTKLLIHFHGDFWQNKYWLKENILNYPLLLISKLTIKRADALRVVSPAIKKKLTASGIPAALIKVIPTPVNLGKIKSTDNQTISSIKQQFSGKKIILWVGRLSPEKNLPWFLEVLKKVISQYPDLVFLIAGKGREFNLINTTRVKLGIADYVKLLGSVNYKELVNYYHAADIFVLPSLHESFGKVLLEAAVAAKPVVASATTGAKEIIQDKKTGYLVPINNQKQFTDKLLNLLTNENLAQQMGAAAFKHVQQEYNYHSNIQAIISFWKQIIGHLRFQDHQI